MEVEAEVDEVEAEAEVEHRRGWRVLITLQCVDVVWGRFWQQTEEATPRNKVEGRVFGSDFPTCIDLILEKIKSKNFKKGVDSRLWAVNDAVERWIYSGGLDDAVIEKRK
jgi:hypothetical protein